MFCQCAYLQFASEIYKLYHSNHIVLQLTLDLLIVLFDLHRMTDVNDYKGLLTEWKKYIYISKHSEWKPESILQSTVMSAPATKPDFDIVICLTEPLLQGSERKMPLKDCKGSVCWSRLSKFKQTALYVINMKFNPTKGISFIQ